MPTDRLSKKKAFREIIKKLSCAETYTVLFGATICLWGLGCILKYKFRVQIFPK